MSKLLNSRNLTRIFTILIIFALSSYALNTVKGNVYISETIRAKQLIVSGSDSESSSLNENIDNTDASLASAPEELDTASEGIITNNIWCESCFLNVVSASEKIISEELSTHLIRGAKVNPTNLGQPSGTIIIEGELSLSEKISETSTEAETTATPKIGLLETASVTVNGTPQWNLLETETFSFSKAQSNSTLLQNGWKVIKHDSSESQLVPLKTDSLESAAAGTLGEEIAKRFDEIPEHEFLKIEANFYFLSPFWKGESAQIRIDNRIVWLDSHDWSQSESLPSGVETICDFRIEDLNSFVWVYPISFVVKHSKPTFLLELGLTKTLDSILACKESSNGVDKLKSVPLFGFDDFSLYFK